MCDSKVPFYFIVFVWLFCIKVEYVNFNENTILFCVDWRCISTRLNGIDHFKTNEKTQLTKYKVICFEKFGVSFWQNGFIKD